MVSRLGNVECVHIRDRSWLTTPVFLTKRCRTLAVAMADLSQQLADTVNRNIAEVWLVYNELLCAVLLNEISTDEDAGLYPWLADTCDLIELVMRDPYYAQTELWVVWREYTESAGLLDF